MLIRNQRTVEDDCSSDAFIGCLLYYFMSFCLFFEAKSHVTGFEAFVSIDPWNSEFGFNSCFNLQLEALALVAPKGSVSISSFQTNDPASLV